MGLLLQYGGQNAILQRHSVWASDGSGELALSSRTGEVSSPSPAACLLWSGWSKLFPLFNVMSSFISRDTACLIMWAWTGIMYLKALCFAPGTDKESRKTFIFLFLPSLVSCVLCCRCYTCFLQLLVSILRHAFMSEWGRTLCTVKEYGEHQLRGVALAEAHPGSKLPEHF